MSCFLLRSLQSTGILAVDIALCLRTPTEQTGSNSFPSWLRLERFTVTFPWFKHITAYTTDCIKPHLIEWWEMKDPRGQRAEHYVCKVWVWVAIGGNVALCFQVPICIQKIKRLRWNSSSWKVAEEGWEGGYTVLDELAIYPFMLNVGFPLATALATWLRELDPLN